MIHCLPNSAGKTNIPILIGGGARFCCVERCLGFQVI